MGALVVNWRYSMHRRSKPPGRYFTACVAFLSVTGFECTPSCIEVIHLKDYPAILRNLIIVSALRNTVLCFLACALLSVGTIVGGTNVLSALGDLAGGSWLRILILNLCSSVER
ncbi:hypothetical protein BJV78DRAFT_263048 [Lactifluus subvellereus]|nr:hypothetical protein BJV78DRAFT_263048 [Lactifluus subvellereus]